jgi:DNA repair protein RadA/Sms
MQSTGLRAVENPSETLVLQHQQHLSGTAIASTLEGMRPLMIEVQALVSSAVYGTPQRSATGFDLKRLNMLLAVLEKRANFKLGAKDVFLNITGGIKIQDPAIDLAVLCAILSSSLDLAIPKLVCFSAEIGLAGEIRPINRVENRILEAQKLGFEKIIVSSHNKLAVNKFNIEVIPLGKVEDLLNVLF